ncbi:MAG: hypothetical protein QOH49_472 [Acidobacteriota bacterium]|jgi:hypothetical protein|nr:hypothetical protein [Acidobacteriota bacterium]
MLEIKPTYDSEDPERYLLIADGVPLEDVSVSKDGNRFTYSARTHDSSQKLTAYKFTDFPTAVYVSLKHRLDWFNNINSVSLLRHFGGDTIDEDDPYYDLTFEIGKLSEWRGLYSFSEYYPQLVKTLEESGSKEIVASPNRDYEGSDFYYVIFNQARLDTPINDEISRCSGIFKAIHRQVDQALKTIYQDTSVVMLFDFPEEVRVPCEQYLLYFIQFLKDLGVEAEAEIQHGAGQVLFAVTPTDKQTALDKIRTALEAYLQLPSNPATGDTSIIEYEVAVQRLAANIDHLKGQLRLAHAELRLAGATIQTQQVTIDHLLSGKIIVESLKDVTLKAKEEDKEELLSGTVALTKVNWKGVEFNLPEIFRKLRRLFKEEE